MPCGITMIGAVSLRAPASRRSNESSIATSIAIARAAQRARQIGARFDGQKKGDERRADETADAEQCMEARHERPARRALDLDRMNVHRDVERSERSAEAEERHPSEHRRGPRPTGTAG